MSRCRSSAGCEESGTHGTFGDHFCHAHYIEIRAICDAMKSETKAKAKASARRKKKPRQTAEQKFNDLLTEVDTP